MLLFWNLLEQELTGKGAFLNRSLLEQELHRTGTPRNSIILPNKGNCNLSVCIMLTLSGWQIIVRRRWVKLFVCRCQLCSVLCRQFWGLGEIETCWRKNVLSRKHFLLCQKAGDILEFLAKCTLPLLRILDHSLARFSVSCHGKVPDLAILLMLLPLLVLWQ